MKKKDNLYLGAFILIAFMSVVIYSCNSDGDNFDNGVRPTLINSVAKSNDFLDFERNSEVLFEKTLSYTSTLTPAEFDELLYNLNNDDYMEEFVKKANIENEISAFSKEKVKLARNKDFSKLNKTERTKLFLETPKLNSSIKVKTRSETDLNECDERRLADYGWARAKADLGLIGCTCTVEVPIVACACYALVLANYADDIRLADRAYEDCMRSVH